MKTSRVESFSALIFFYDNKCKINIGEKRLRKCGYIYSYIWLRIEIHICNENGSNENTEQNAADRESGEAHAI